MSKPDSIRILYADDDFDSLELVRFMLNRENEAYRVLTASSIVNCRNFITNKNLK
jgi:CheY-like chemotaxis protein